MCVVVTSHAVRQYQEKVLRFTQEKISNEEIRERLAQVAELGSLSRMLPGGAAEYEYGDLFATIRLKENEVVVVTCNGDREWRHWWRRQGVWRRSKRRITAAP